MKSFFFHAGWTMGRRLPLLRLLLPVAMVCLTLVVVCYTSYRTDERQLTDKNVEALRAITELKIREIGDWVAGLDADACFIQRNRITTDFVRRWLRNRRDGRLTDAVQEWLLSVQHEGYERAAILDAAGTPLLGAPKPPPARVQSVDTFRAAVSTGKIAQSDLHRGLEGEYHIDVWVPLREDGNGAVFAVLLLKINPERFLGPVVRFWPVRSQTARSLLVRRDGNQAQVLSGGGDGRNGGLVLKLDPTVVEGRAAMGYEGSFEGRDHRGHEVLAYVRKLPGTSAALLARIDKDEIYSEARAQLRWMLGLSTVVLLLAATLVHSFWQREVVEGLERRLRTEAERRAIAEKYENVLQAINDAFWIADLSGITIEVNQRACAVYGYRREELVGTSCGELRTDAARSGFAAEIARLRTAGPLGTVYETMHRDRGGREFPVEISARLAKLDGEERILFLGRDISERKRAEAELRQAEEKFRVLVEELPAVTYIAPLDSGGTAFVSPQIESVLGFTREEWGSGPAMWAQQVHPEDRERVLAEVRELHAHPAPYRIEYRMLRRDGTFIWCQDHVAPIRDAQGNVHSMAGVLFDVTERKKAEERLNLLESAVVNARDAVVIARADAARPGEAPMVFVNHALLEQTGYSERECIGRPYSDLFGPEGGNPGRASVAEAFRSHRPARLECLNFRKTGEPFWVEVNLFPLLDAAGRCTHVVSICRDISERRRMEAVLRQSEALLRNIADTVPSVIWKGDVEGNCTFLNKAWESLTGQDPEHALGRGWTACIHPDDLGNVRKEIHRAAGEFEFRLRPADGESRWMFAKAGLQAKAGTRGEVVLSFTDITDRMCMEQELRRSEARLMVAQGTAGLAFWEWDVRTGKVSCPEETYVLCGLEWRRDDLSYEQFLSIVHPEDRDAVLRGLEEAIQTRSAFRCCARVRRPDGATRWLAYSGHPQFDAAGRASSVVGATIDITELRKSELELQRMNAELRRLSAELLRSQDQERRRIARELHDGTCQTLAALSMTLAAMDESGAEGERRTGPIGEAMAMLDDSLREIRSLSYLLHPPLLDELGLVSALRNYVEGFSRRTGTRVAFAAAEFERMDGDVELTLFRIVQEALSNIHRHSGSTDAMIELSQPGDSVRLSVSDRGRGIPAEVLRDGKTGVGLAGMRQRAMQLGGELDIRSDEHGTTIIVTIPRHALGGPAGVFAAAAPGEAVV